MTIDLKSLSLKLWPLHRTVVCRSYKKSIDIIASYFESGWTRVHKIPSGTELSAGWVVPKGWDMISASLTNEHGEEIVNLNDTNLRIPSHSKSISIYTEPQTILDHFYTSESMENHIPYVTSYYSEDFWGVCVTKKEKERIANIKGRIRLNIDTSSYDYAMYIAERHFGNADNYIVVNTYLCHPSMANNELSGPLVIASLIKSIEEDGNINLNKCGIKFLIWPETIGPIAYKHLINDNHKVFNVITITCVGLSDKKYSVVPGLNNSWNNQVIDAFSGQNIDVLDWSSRGSDERQLNWHNDKFNSITITKGTFGQYPEYHTSADDFELVSVDGLQDVAQDLLEVLSSLTNMRRPRYMHSCEPFLSNLGIYPKVSFGGHSSFGKDLCELFYYCNGVNNEQDIKNMLHRFDEKYIRELIDYGYEVELLE